VARPVVAAAVERSAGPAQREQEAEAAAGPTCRPSYSRCRPPPTPHSGLAPPMDRLRATPEPAAEEDVGRRFATY